MISGSQIRAARALLNWTLEDLALRTDLNVNTLLNIEKGISQPKQKTIEQITTTFLADGVAFTKSGVEMRDNTVTVISGENWFLRLLDDVQFTLARSAQPELLVEGGDDRKSSADVIRKIRALRADKVQIRVLSEEGNNYFLGSLSEYRCIPRGHFTNYVTLVYGDKIAICTDNNTKAMVFKDPLLSLTRRNMFNLLWSVLKQPVKNESNERY